MKSQSQTGASSRRWVEGFISKPGAQTKSDRMNKGENRNPFLFFTFLCGQLKVETDGKELSVEEVTVIYGKCGRGCTRTSYCGMLIFRSPSHKKAANLVNK